MTSSYGSPCSSSKNASSLSFNLSRRDFQGYSVVDDKSFWNDRYKEFFIKGWQWDQKHRHPYLKLSNNQFTVEPSNSDIDLINDITIRGSHFLEPKKSLYFEIQVHCTDSSQPQSFDKSDTQIFSFGLVGNECHHDGQKEIFTASKTLTIYNDGSLFIHGAHADIYVYLSLKRRKIRSGDRIGYLVKYQENSSQIAVTVYLNGNAITNPIPVNFEGPIYPHLHIVKPIVRAEIITWRTDYPIIPLTSKQLAYECTNQGRDKWRALSYFKIRNFLGAVENFSRVINITPDKSLYYVYRATVYESIATGAKSDAKQNYYNLAFADTEKALSLEPNNVTALVNRGYLNEKIGKFEKSLEDYSRAINLEPDSAVVYKNRGDLYETMGDLENALKDYNQSLLKDPTMASTFNNRGYVHKRMGNFQLALEDYNKAIELDPKDANIYTNRGQILEKLKLHNQAIADYDQAIALDPSWASAYNSRGNHGQWLVTKKRLGLYYKSIGMLDEALADYNHAISLDPSSDFYVNRASIYQLMGDKEQALKDYQKSLDMEPANDTAYNNRANFWNSIGMSSYGCGLIVTGNYEKAIEDSTKAIELAPKEGNPYSHRAFALCSLGKLEEALKDVNISLQLSKFYVRGYCNRAYIYFQMGNLESALQDCDAGIAMDRDVAPDIYYVKGLVLWKRKQVESAIQNFETSLALKNRMRNFPEEQVVKMLNLCIDALK